MLSANVRIMFADGQHRDIMFQEDLSPDFLVSSLGRESASRWDGPSPNFHGSLNQPSAVSCPFLWFNVIHL